MIINGSRPNDDNASNLNQWEKIGTFSLDNIVIKNKNVNAESTRYFPISIDQSITKVRFVLKKNFSVTITPDTSKITSYGSQIDMTFRLWLNSDPVESSTNNILIHNIDAQFHYKQKTPVNTTYSTDKILWDGLIQENHIFHFSDTTPEIECLTLHPELSNNFIYQMPIFYEVSMIYRESGVGVATGYGTITINGNVEIYAC